MLIKCLLCTRHCAGWYAYKISFDGDINLLRTIPVAEMRTLRLRSNLRSMLELQSGGAGREITAAPGPKLFQLYPPTVEELAGSRVQNIPLQPNTGTPLEASPQPFQDSLQVSVPQEHVWREGAGAGQAAANLYQLPTAFSQTWPLSIQEARATSAAATGAHNCWSEER